MNIMYKHIFPNFGGISFINKEMVSFLKLHIYKFGLVHVLCTVRMTLYRLSLERIGKRCGLYFQCGWMFYLQ